MRLDHYLSRVGLVKRRSIAKELADKGLIEVNSNRSKPSRDIKESDIIKICGSRQVTVEIIKIPAGSVKKEERENYFSILH